MSDPRAFDPIASYAATLQAARQFAKNPAAIALGGKRSGGTWSWRWTLLGEGSVAVEVDANQAGPVVREHEVRQYFVAPSAFDPAVVRVTPAQVAASLAKAGKRGTVEALSLAKAPGAKGRLLWTATLATGDVVSIDAIAGGIAN